MWLPQSIYERIPQFYVLAGLLLITDGIYLGFEYSISLSYFYFAVGLAILIHGLRLYILRKNYRKAKRADQARSGNVDSTVGIEKSAPSPEALGNKITTEQPVQH